MESFAVLFAIVATVFVWNSQAELIRECSCSEIGQCRERLLSFVKPCADKCQIVSWTSNHSGTHPIEAQADKRPHLVKVEQLASKVHADYRLLKDCFLQREPQILKTISCTETAFNSSCAKEPGRYVQKRYLESLEISGLEEINRMLGGLAQDVQPLIAVGRKFTKCVRGCMDRSSRYCAERLKCGLDLPSDSVLVQTAKQCAISSGFSTEAVQQFCNCAVSSGLEYVFFPYFLIYAV
ncbi:unnamed protein product [Gongylonema pulchrum]|uniref:CPG4 domain-containing protein n=1 Tax=Gongylonema pulchrum TaxID=637853 RepID=A0A183CVC0_9BILA|nr:unnamed protein product [Gongylonema pulchrum]